MSSFAVTKETISAVLPIEGADRIEAVKVGDYNCVVAKGQFKEGDSVLYIPEQAVLPETLLARLGLTGKLSGSLKNRVKAIKLKGVLSQGLVLGLAEAADEVSVQCNGNCRLGTFTEMPLGWIKTRLEDFDFAEYLGITKYEPPLPTSFSGQLTRPRGNYSLLRYDVENIKRWPGLLLDGELVVITEKIHGTLMQAVYWPSENQFAVSSKGLGARGFIIEDTEANAGNVYVQAAKKFDLEAKMRSLHLQLSLHGRIHPHEPLFVVGEVFGKGVQDLDYAAELGFRVFDIYVGEPNSGHYLDAIALPQTCAACGLEPVPVLYIGNFTNAVLSSYVSGQESVSGRATHMREGVVIKPVHEQTHPRLGRVALKAVSEAYLLRKGGTEYN